MAYKSTDGLMRHLRCHGITIGGSTEKRQLRNTGYFHGYKGYRFFGNSQNKIPFTTFSEVYATIQYDSKLKALLYDKIMFIETAVKNIALEGILHKTKSESIQAMYDIAVSSYINSDPALPEKAKKEMQKDKLNLQNRVQNYLLDAYTKGNPQITHFYNNMSYSGVPVWALFEIMTMGDIGFLLSCLTYDTRKDISKRLGILNTAVDTNLQLVYKYIYALKDLRNAVAHNAVVFDTRFRKFDPTSAMKRYLEAEIGLPYITFKTFGDYVILICHYLKRLGVPKIEIKAFIREFEKIVADYKTQVGPNIAAVVIHPDWESRMNTLKKYL